MICLWDRRDSPRANLFSVYMHASFLIAITLSLSLDLCISLSLSISVSLSPLFQRLLNRYFCMRPTKNKRKIYAMIQEGKIDQPEELKEDG